MYPYLPLASDFHLQHRLFKIWVDVYSALTGCCSLIWGLFIVVWLVRELNSWKLSNGLSTAKRRSKKRIFDDNWIIIPLSALPHQEGVSRKSAQLSTPFISIWTLNELFFTCAYEQCHWHIQGNHAFFGWKIKRKFVSIQDASQKTAYFSKNGRVYERIKRRTSNQCAHSNIARHQKKCVVTWENSDQRMYLTSDAKRVNTFAYLGNGGPNFGKKHYLAIFFFLDLFSY